MRAVHVYFYRPSPDDHWLNHAVTRIAPPYSHCDLQFENELATSVYQHEAVYLERKTFSRVNYDCLSLTLDEAEYARVFNFCHSAHQRKVGFDLLGMLCSPLPMRLRSPPHVTFCSRYVLEALQQAGRPALAPFDATTMTPSNLHKTLSSINKSNFIHIPSKRIQICLK